MLVVSQEVLAKAIELRSKGWGWRKMPAVLGISEYAIRCALEPGYRQERLENVRHIRYLRQQGIYQKRSMPRPPRPARYSCKTGHSVSTMLDIPPEVLADKAHRATLEHHDFTAAFCGDPLPGRSALDKRHAPA
jgi:hypothetical protein